MAVQSQDTQPLKRSRLLYIDNLRIVLTALVVLHHLAIQYGGSGITYYKEVGPVSDICSVQESGSPEPRRAEARYGR